MADETPAKVIDLTDIAYIDSYALGQIIYYCNNSGGRHGTVHILNRTCGANTFIDRLIEVSDLGQIFTLVTSLDAIDRPAKSDGA